MKTVRCVLLGSVCSLLVERMLIAARQVSGRENLGTIPTSFDGS